MPVVRRGFLFTYFDKIICGVVALGVLAAIVFAALQATAHPGSIPRDQVVAGLEGIQAALKGPAQPLRVKDWEKDILRTLTEVRSPQPVRIGVFYPALNKRYGPIKIAPSAEVALEFEQPLTGGSAKVVGPQDILRVVEHPVNGDYKRVLVRSLGKEGQAEVVGDVGSLEHLYPVIVTKDAGKTAYPPSKVTSRKAPATIVLDIQPNKANDESGVMVASYEIWRRDWEDPLGDYSKVGDLKPQETGGRPSGVGMPAGPVFGPMRPASGPGGIPSRSPFAASATATEGALIWQDAKISPGASYSYKVRTSGTNTTPAQGEFTAPLLVTASPDVDFRFTASKGLTVGFDVAKLFSTSDAAKETFWNAIGDEIGGTAKDAVTNQRRSFETQETLVDFQRGVNAPGVGFTDRVVYTDRDGNLYARLRGQTKSQVWEMLRQAAPVIPGMPSGGPGVGVPRIPGFAGARPSAPSGGPGRRR
jgi:hypothetical protein